MLGQKDFRIVDLNKTSMCRITEFRDSETSPIPQVIDDIADQVHVTADDLVQKPKESVGTPNDVELSSRSAAASPMRETGGDEFQWDLQSVHDIEEDHSCEAGEGLTGNNDMSLEEFIGEYKQIMAQDGCPGELDADEFPCTIDLGDMDHSPAFNSDLSSLPLQRMGDGETMCIGYSNLERFQYGGQHTGDDVLLPQFAQEQFPVEKEWQPGVLDGSAFSRPLRSSSCPMSSEVLSDQHVSTASFAIHYGGQSWNSIPSAGNEDSKAQDSASGRSNPHIGDGDVDATRFKNAATVKAPRYPEHSDCAISLQEIDQDRPSQTCGSVLASEGMVTDSIYGIGNATTSMAYGNGDRLTPRPTDRQDVVDLTEDSDDDMECIDRRGRVGQGKHKAEDHGGECMRKRPTVCGGRSDTTQISDSKSVAPGQMSSWQQYPFGGESRVQVRSLESNQVAQQWSATSSWHLPSSKDSVQTGHLPLLSLSKDFPHTVADKSNSTHLSPYDHSSTKRKLSAGLPSSANPASNLRGNDSGLGSEDSAPEGLAVALLKHQRLALKWMLKREELIPSGGILADDQGLGKTVTTLSLILKARAPLQKSSVNNMSALPKALTVELDDDDDVGDNTQADGCSQAMSLSGTKRSGLHPSRDIVGSVSGLHNVPENVKTESAKRRPAAGTLVVCPTSVLRQWAHEVKDKVKASADLTMLIYHGSNRTKDPDELAKYDVVLTTYSIVSMESPKQAISDEKDNEKSMSGYSGADSDLPPPFRSWKAKKPKKPVDKPNKSKGSAEFGPLARLNWFRVVLDEAQSIKNSRTQVARAAWNLKAKKRWCLSGTPIQNAIDDLYSYFRFLRCYPYDSYKVFRERIKDPCARTPAQGYKELQKCLSEVMIRRTKATLIDGQPIVDLPARIVTLKQAHFSDEERAFYNNLELESRKQFKDYAAAGTLQSNYVNILWMLLRLRQACDHPLLVKGQIYGSSTQSDVLLSAKELPVEKRMHLLSLLEASNDMCSICNDVLEHPVVCICAHIFCRQCILDQLAIGDDMSCPKCRKPLKISSVYSLSALRNPNRVEDVGGEPSACLDLHSQDEDFKSTENIDWKSSAKINAVIETLNALPPLSGDEDVKTESERRALEAGHELESEKPNGAFSNGKMTKELTMVANPGRHSFVENRLLSLTDPSLLSRNLDSTSSTYGGAEVDMTSSDAAFNGGDKATTQAPKQEPSSADALEPPKKQTATEKAIVFSQWTSMLDLLEVKLKEANFNYRRLDGTMSVVARDRAVSEFKSKPEVTVIIMSLKAASLGLNMVAACHVLLLDVWWNPTTEDQAIDRAHRIGQTRVVRVSRFTVKDTIEDRILALQEKKRRMVATAFGDERGALQRGGLTQQDMHHLFGVSE